MRNAESNKDDSPKFVCFTDNRQHCRGHKCKATERCRKVVDGGTGSPEYRCVPRPCGKKGILCKNCVDSGDGVKWCIDEDTEGDSGGSSSSGISHDDDSSSSGNRIAAVFSHTDFSSTGDDDCFKGEVCEKSHCTDRTHCITHNDCSRCQYCQQRKDAVVGYCAPNTIGMN